MHLRSGRPSTPTIFQHDLLQERKNHRNHRLVAIIWHSPLHGNWRRHLRLLQTTGNCGNHWHGWFRSDRLFGSDSGGSSWSHNLTRGANSKARCPMPEVHLTIFVWIAGQHNRRHRCHCHGHPPLQALARHSDKTSGSFRRVRGGRLKKTNTHTRRPPHHVKRKHTHPKNCRETTATTPKKTHTPTTAHRTTPRNTLRTLYLNQPFPKLATQDMYGATKLPPNSPNKSFCQGGSGCSG